MKFATSCFNKALFLKNIKRFWPVWVLYIIAWVIGMPLVIASALSHDYYSLSYDALGDYILNNALYMGVIMNAIFGLISALTVFSYLYTARSVGAFHTLPIRREGLFLTCFASGLSWLLLSNLFIFGLSALTEALYGALVIGYLLEWLAMVCLEALFFFGFGVFCALLTGHGFAMPIIYGILNFIVIIIENIIRFCASLFCYGLSSGGSTSLDVLSPAYMLLINTSVQGVNTPNYDFYYTGWSTLIIYALAGLVFSALALLLYRRRHSESATEFIAVRSLRPVFQYFFAFIGSLILGTLFYVVIFEISNYNATGSAYPMLACMILGGFLGYFITAMLLKKSFKVFRKTTPGFLVYTVALAALVMAMEFDVFGLERYIPDIDSVESLRIYGSTEVMVFDDPNVISDLMQTHEAIFKNKSANEKFAGRYSNGASVNYMYYLDNGKSVMRRYYLYDAPEADKEILALFESGINTPAAISDRMSDILDLDINSVVSVSINYIDASGDSEENLLAEYLTGKDAQGFLRDCIKADIQAGKLGRTAIFYDSSSENAAYECFINIYFKGKSEYITLSPNVTSEKTMEYLKKMGIEPSISQYQKHAEYYYSEYSGYNEYEEYSEYSEYTGTRL